MSSRAGESRPAYAVQARDLVAEFWIGDQVHCAGLKAMRREA